MFRTLLKIGGVLGFGFAFAATLLQLQALFDPRDITFSLQPNTRMVYDARGIYDGAGFIDYQIDAHGLSQPMLEQPSDNTNLLLLGDSIPEAYFVQPEQRVAHIIGLSDDLRVYNGARAGATIYDMYYNYQHIRRSGIIFDTVLLSTLIRDYAVTVQYANEGQVFDHEVYRAEAESDHTGVIETPIDLLQETEFWGYMRNFYHTELAPTLDEADVANSSLDSMLERMDAFMEGKTVVDSLEDCPMLPDVLETYEAVVRDGFQRFLNLTEEDGFQLIVTSLPDGYLADEASFYNDLRAHTPCGDDLVLSFEASHDLYEILNPIYLQIAEEMDIATIDLRTAVADEFDDQGGLYTYDGIHYTERGSVLVGEALRPAIEALIETE